MYLRVCKVRVRGEFVCVLWKEVLLHIQIYSALILNVVVYAAAKKYGTFRVGKDDREMDSVYSG